MIVRLWIDFLSALFLSSIAVVSLQRTSDPKVAVMVIALFFPIPFAATTSSLLELWKEIKILRAKTERSPERRPPSMSGPRDRGEV